MRPQLSQEKQKSHTGSCDHLWFRRWNRRARGLLVQEAVIRSGARKWIALLQETTRRWILEHQKSSGTGSSANSPLVQRGCLFPEPVKVKNQWDRVCRSTFACQSQYNRLKTKKALSTPQTPWSWSLQRRTPAHASRGPFRTLQWSRSSSPASLYRWRTRGSSRLFPARRRSLWRWSLQQNRPR